MNFFELCNKYNEGEKLSFVFFWNIRDNNEEFSNWYPSKFIVDGISYWCVEQYMMAQKAKLFDDYETLSEIMQSKYQKEIKALGRKVHNFDSKIWDENKEKIVYEGNFAKFSQNPNLRQKLLDTKDAILAEASPFDKIWGIGLSERDGVIIYNPNNWQGENLLGFILMKVRKELKK